MSTPGPTHSQANRAPIVGAGLSKAHSTTSLSRLSHTTRNLSDDSMAAAAGKTSTTPVPGYPSSISHVSTRNPPVHITNDAVKGGDDSTPTTQDSSVHAVHQHTCCLPRRGRPFTLKRTAIVLKDNGSGDMPVSTPRRTKWRSPVCTTCTVGTSTTSTIPVCRRTSSSALPQSSLSSPMQHPSDAMGRDNNAPIVGGPVVPTFLQHSSGLPGQNMRGHCVTTGHQNTQSPTVRTTCTATRDSTVPLTTGKSHGKPVTHSTSSTPDQSSSASGGSTMQF